MGMIASVKKPSDEVLSNRHAKPQKRPVYGLRKQIN
jgi:hypothetical protein